MAKQHKFLYGPVSSRRLGLSLGVDIVPFKICTLDCVYCQLGKTTKKTTERKEYVPVKPILAELKDRVAEGLKADFVTIGGCGEPILNSRLGQLIDGIKKITDIPVAILTNGTLLCRDDVRSDCAKADVVLPSLDAGDEQTFRKINRPHKDISFEKLVDGLCAFRAEFAGRIWLEVFLIEGFNTENGQIAAIADAIRRIRPDKVQLNTAVRPTAQPTVKAVSPERLRIIAGRLGDICEVVSSTAHSGRSPLQHVLRQADVRSSLLSILKRRPCSLNDICSALSIAHNEALKHLGHLQKQGLIASEHRDGQTFFRIN